MRILLKRLLAILSQLKPGLVSGSVYEQASHFLFNGKYVWTYNDHMCAIHPFKTKFPFSVNAQDFHSLCTKLNNTGFDVISITLEKNKLLIKAKNDKGKSKKEFEGRIDCLSTIEEMSLFFNQFSLDQNKWNPLPDNFVEGVDLCLLSLSDDITDRRFSSVHVHKKYLLSSDDIRLTKVNLSSPMNDSFVMPGFNLSYFSNFTFDKYLIDFPWSIFKSSESNVILCIRLVDQEPLDPGDIFGFDKMEIAVPVDFKEVVDLCSVSSDETGIIKFCFNNNSLECKGTDESKHFAIKQDIDFKGKETIFSGSTLFLKQLFDIIDIKNFKMFCCKEKSKLLFASDQVQHLLALINEKG